MTIKQYMQVLVENITGRKCSNCKYNKKPIQVGICAQMKKPQDAHKEFILNTGRKRSKS